MILLILIPGYILINIYIILRILKWLHACHNIFRSKPFIAIYIAVYIFLSSTLLTSFLWPSGEIQRFLKLISNYWLGTFLYILLFTLIADIIHLFLRFTHRLPEKGSAKARYLLMTGGFLVSTLVILISFYGGSHAHHVKLKNYEISIPKSCTTTSGEPVKSLRIALAADLHLGYSIGTEHVQKMVNLINENQVDLICLAGDIYDNEYEAIKDPQKISELLASLKSTYGTYACLGNHDVDERLLSGFSVSSNSENMRDPRLVEMLQKGNVMILDDEVIPVDNAFYLIGRVDCDKPGTGKAPASIESLTQGLDLRKPVIVMEHEPANLSATANAGVDLEVAGHTHDGQLFPGNLAVKLKWENPCGLLQKGDFHSIVTSGLGVWGPFMRVFTDSEVVIIDVTFQNT